MKNLCRNRQGMMLYLASTWILNVNFTKKAMLQSSVSMLRNYDCWRMFHTSHVASDQLFQTNLNVNVYKRQLLLDVQSIRVLKEISIGKIFGV